MTIKSGVDEFEYTFRYLGDSASWVNSTTSEIFICYIYDKKGNGGSFGNGKWEKTDTRIQRDMIRTFEEYFIKKIDDNLNVRHLEI